MITLAQITMNAGESIPGSTIRWNLKKNAQHFDRVIIIDGELTEQAQNFYSQFPNVEVVDSPWNDSHVAQYRAFSEKLKDGEWCLYLDCDEVPSENLIIFLKDHFETIKKEQPDINMFYLPCVLYLTEDGVSYFAAESKPKNEFSGQWTKHILFKKTSQLDFRFFGSHVIPTFNQYEKGYYISAPYLHMKSLQSFVYNDVWQAFLHPEGQGYLPGEAHIFKTLLKSNNIKSMKDLKKSIKDGTWDLALSTFAWNKKREVNRPISRLAWAYFYLAGHAPPGSVWSEVLAEGNWKIVKNNVLSKDSMKIYYDNQEKKENYLEIKE